ncbi:MAG TPA: SpoIIE family protein phosphatase [Phycisphaerales bacterium]|nr:SpoIIE family protein phosphatase [Phycisphaerales bacterium]
MGRRDQSGSDGRAAPGLGEPEGAGGAACAPAPGWDRVVEVMERLAASSDLDEVLGLIVDSLRDCLDAERASVLQYDPARHELFATRAHGVGASLRFSADLGLAGEAVRTRRIVSVPDCYADPRFNRDVDRATGFRTRCLLSIPLASLDGKLEGVAQVLNKRPGRDGGVFGPGDEAVARALSSQAAIALRRARLLESERRKNKIEADLRIAKEVQQSTLPSLLPDVAGFDIAATTNPAEETGGDTFDLTPLGMPCPGGPGDPVSRVMILMADATGHGIGPALSVTQVQSMLRMAGRLGAPLTEIVCHLNALMCEALPAGRFVTAFLGELDAGRHEVAYVSAGQAPIVVVRASGEFECFDASTPPVGIDPDLKVRRTETVRFGPGDVLVLLSDGYYELRGPGGKGDDMLGVERVVELVRAAIGGSAEEILGALIRGAAAFARGRPADDDQTAIIIKRTG